MGKGSDILKNRLFLFLEHCQVRKWWLRLQKYTLNLQKLKSKKFGRNQNSELSHSALSMNNVGDVSFNTLATISS